MSLELRELYQEMILDHNREPRNHHPIADATEKAEGYNPLCGDKLTVYVKLEGECIADLSFVGSGCAISQASASLMTEAIKGHTVEEAHQLFHRFHQMMTLDESVTLAPSDKLNVLAGVKAFPARVKCATLAWHTMEAALKREVVPVTTE
jgi:nitrogen fixation NifU-like protein